MIKDIVPIRQALISVHDKTGVVEFAADLVKNGVEILSTGGTAKALRDAGLDITEVSDYTGYPELFDGRVKTLHPMVHGGLLYRRDDDKHTAAASIRGIKPIDLLVVNLYPFAATVAKGAPHEEIVENIDIGGPAMIRSAAKNCASVAVVTDPGRYAAVMGQIVQTGGLSLRWREILACEAFNLTEQYDTQVCEYYRPYIDEKYLLK